MIYETSDWDKEMWDRIAKLNGWLPFFNGEYPAEDPITGIPPTEKVIDLGDEQQQQKGAWPMTPEHWDQLVSIDQRIRHLTTLKYEVEEDLTKLYRERETLVSQMEERAGE